MDGKVLEKETKKKIVEILDDVTKLPLWAEMVDGMGYRILVDFLDNQGDKYIPDEYDSLIDSAINLALSGNYEESSEVLGHILDSVIDISSLDDDAEELVFVEGARFITRMIVLWVEQKKQN